MNSNKRFYKTMSGKLVDRTPVVPKIWVDLAANLTSTPIVNVISDPATALKVIVDAGLICKVDAVRQFHFPNREITTEDEEVYEVNKAGKKLGVIDMKGGLITHLYDDNDYKLDNPYIMAHHHYWVTKKPVVKSIEDVKKIVIPSKQYLKDIGLVSRQQKIIEYTNNRLELIGDCSSATLAFYVCLRGMDQAMFDLIENEKLVHAVMEKGTAIAIEKGKMNIDMGIMVLRLNDSIANMSVISPTHFRKFIKPHIKTVCDELHHYNKNVKIYCHICGNVLPIMEDLIDTGLDCIAPLDPLGGGATCKQYRKRAGDEIVLMGGVNTMSFIQRTPDEIEKEATECIESAGSNGNFILGSGCVVPRMATKESLLALVKASKTKGLLEK
ncbi:MAG: hypothetical protein KAG94_00320 [Clostridiales bacterium]|nr:hypothetical protein [Clostridiales bacterium]